MKYCSSLLIIRPFSISYFAHLSLAKIQLMSQLVEEKVVSNFAAMEQPRHVLLIIFPAQGHINPSLQFAKRLIRMGVEVTVATTVFAHQRMYSKAAGMLKGLNFATFSDGYDEGYKHGVTDAKDYMAEIKIRGSNALRDIIVNSAEQGRPVTLLVYALLLHWTAEVAREFHIPSALLWIQPATVLDIYHYYFNGYEDEITKNCNNPNWSIQLPGLPLLSRHDLPSLIVPPTSASNVLLQLFEGHIEILDREANPKVLVNTFDALEPEALQAIEKYNLIAVGPLIPSAFLDGQDPSDTSFGGDLCEKSKDYMEWLNSKPESSVVYVSFGSMLILQKEQMEEIARGLLETGRPFLWVIRANKNGEDQKEEEKLSCMEELEQKGMIVPWCSQLEVLRHPSLGCFVTHCGWNSTLESIACGVPVVAFPHWTDQGTNAKLIQDVWRTGVRVTANENGTVASDEIKNCIEIIMDGGVRGQELRMNARKWKDLAREAMQEGGSSDKNLKSLVEEVGKDFH